MLKLDDDYSGEKLPDEDKTNGCGGASWLGEEDETNWPNDVARTTYKDALVKSKEWAHSIWFTKKLIWLIAVLTILGCFIGTIS